MVKGGLGVEGSSEVNGRGHVVMETEVDAGQGVVTHRLSGGNMDTHEHLKCNDLPTLYNNIVQ